MQTVWHPPLCAPLNIVQHGHPPRLAEPLRIIRADPLVDGGNNRGASELRRIFDPRVLPQEDAVLVNASAQYRDSTIAQVPPLLPQYGLVQHCCIKVSGSHDRRDWQGRLYSIVPP